MKKSKFWTICAAISIIFATHSVSNLDFIQAIVGCASCCTSLVIGAWYEREEKEEKNH